MKKRCLSLAATLTVLLSCAVSGCGTRVDNRQNRIGAGLMAAEPMAASEDWQQVTENETLALFVRSNSGDFYVLDKRNGTVWYSRPQDVDEDESVSGIRRTNLKSQIILNTVGASDTESLSNSYSMCQRLNQTTTVSSIPNGFRATYDFVDPAIELSVEVTLANDFIEICVPPEGILEKGSDRIYSMQVYPNFGTANATEQGYIVTPDGSGSVIFFNTSKEGLRTYTQPVWGKDQAFPVKISHSNSEQAYLPLFGIKKEKAAFVAIAGKGAEYARCNAYIAGQNGANNGAYFELKFRDSYEYQLGSAAPHLMYDKNSLLCDDGYSAVYYFLDTAEANYTAMANRARKVFLGDAEQTEQPLSLMLQCEASTTQDEYVFGISKKRPVSLTDCTSLQKIIEDLHTAGVGRIVTQYIGAEGNQLEGKVSSTVLPSSFLGNTQQWNDLWKLSESDPIALDVSLNVFSKNGHGINRIDSAIRDMTDAPVSVYPIRITTRYRDTKQVPSYFVRSQQVADLVETFAQKQAVHKTLSVNSLADTLYSDFRKYDRNGRTYCLNNTVKSLEALQKAGYTLMTEGANSYALPYVSYVLSAPQQSSGAYLEEYSIPLYQLVMAGTVAYSTPSINLESNPRKLLLQALENGSMLQYTVFGNEDVDILETNADSLISCSYAAIKDRILEYYSEFVRVRTQATGYLVSHQTLTQGVTLSHYSSGAGILVNQTQKPYTAADGTEVSAMSYVVVK